MSVKFYLKNKENETSALNIIICHKGLKLKFPVGISVTLKYWNQARQRAKEVPQYPEAIYINQALTNLENKYKDAINYFIALQLIPTKKDIEDRINNTLSEKSSEKIIKSEKFVMFVSNAIEELKKTRGKESIKTYKVVLDKLIQYENYKKHQLTFEEIDINFYRDFQKWFYDQKYSANYFGNMIKNVKMFMNEANEQGKTNCQGHNSKGFIKISNETDNIYLSTEELLKIYNLDLSEFQKDKRNAYETTRNKFLIGSFTALRVSDFNRLLDINITENYIKIKTQKTQASVIVPLHWVVKEILEKGFNLNTKITDQAINRDIKNICKAAKIDEDVLINESVSGANVQNVYKKWELVSTHTARRSGATNMFKAGIPSISIMKITGHKSEKAFLKYIKITNEENAELLSNHSFFKKKD